MRRHKDSTSLNDCFCLTTVASIKKFPIGMELMKLNRSVNSKISQICKSVTSWGATQIQGDEGVSGQLKIVLFQEKKRP